MIRSSACQPWPADQPGPCRRASRPSLSYTTLRDTTFALVATQILAITGLLLAGGILLLWVCWKMWQETRLQRLQMRAQRFMAAPGGGGHANIPECMPGKTLRQAVVQIIVADVSMSLDNVLAVAGAAQAHMEALIFGLTLSVALMGFASAFIAHLLDRHRWIAYLGLAIILLVALRMIYHGLDEVLGHALPMMA